MIVTDNMLYVALACVFVFLVAWLWCCRKRTKYFPAWVLLRDGQIVPCNVVDTKHRVESRRYVMLEQETFRFCSPHGTFSSYERTYLKWSKQFRVLKQIRDKQEQQVEKR